MQDIDPEGWNYQSDQVVTHSNPRSVLILVLLVT